MITRNGYIFVSMVVLTTLSILLSSCSPRPTNEPPLTPLATITLTDAPQPTATPTLEPSPTANPTLEPSPTATLIPLPALAWNQGDSYFNINGRPAFLFSRNLAGWAPEDWATLAGLAHRQGDQFVARLYEQRVDGGRAWLWL